MPSKKLGHLWRKRLLKEHIPSPKRETLKARPKNPTKIARKNANFQMGHEIMAPKPTTKMLGNPYFLGHEIRLPMRAFNTKTVKT